MAELIQVVQALAEKALWMENPGGYPRVILSRPLRMAIAQARKQGMGLDHIGNTSLAAGWPVDVTNAVVAYAKAIEDTERVNRFWGNA